jgi:hypothetical protein
VPQLDWESRIGHMQWQETCNENGVNLVLVLVCLAGDTRTHGGLIFPWHVGISGRPCPLTVELAWKMEL